MALKDTWLVERQQRQQETIERQQSVQQFLTETRQVRQYQASELHNTLTGFREQLAQQDHTRRVDFQPLQAELAEFRSRLQADTQALLQAACDRRYSQTQQLTYDLQAFHSELQSTVQLIRQSFQAELTELNAQTQEFLAARFQQRMRLNQEMRHHLATFLENLRSDVQSYLSELELLRQERAANLRQELQHSRISLSAEVESFFEQLATFRADLTTVRQILQASVWGHPSAGSEQPSPTSAEIHPLPVVAIAATKESIVQSAAKPRTAPPSSARPPAAMKSSVGVKSPGVPRTVAKASAFSSISRSLTGTSSAPTREEPRACVAYEKDVYTLLHTNQGARLTEIESTLKINRFQAVDALRSLIKKGLITQRDRIYFIQELNTEAR